MVVLCRAKYYDVFTPKASRWILDNLAEKKGAYGNFSPNDFCVRIGQNFVDKKFYKKVCPFADIPEDGGYSQLWSLQDLISKGIVNRCYWKPEAISLIMDHVDDLVR